MIKNKERIIKEKTCRATELITSYVNELDKLSETGDFTIDNIEKLLGELDKGTSELYREASSEIIAQVNEKELIRSKKKSILRRE